MREIIFLYLLATGEPDAIYMGETALLACMESAKTYEVDVACTPPDSSARPYLAVPLTTSPRPVSRSTAQGN